MAQGAVSWATTAATTAATVPSASRTPVETAAIRSIESVERVKIGRWCRSDGKLDQEALAALRRVRARLTARPPVGRSRCPTRLGPVAGRASGSASRAARGRGDRAGRSAAFEGAGAGARARRRGGGVRPPALVSLRDALLLPVAPAEASSNLARYDGVRYGPRVDGATYGEMVERTRDDGLRRRAEAPDHARHVRALGRLLRRVLRPGAEGADAAHPRASEAFARFDVLVTPTSPTVAFPLGDEGGRPARDVRVRPAHDPLVPRRAARVSTSRAGSPTGSRSACS